MTEDPDARRPGRVPALAAAGRLLLGHLPRFRRDRLQDLAATLAADPGRQGSLVMSAVNLSLRVRQRATYQLVLEPRRRSSRRQHAARHPGGEPPPVHRLSLLCPTRARVGLVRTFLASLDRTAVHHGRVECLFYVDDDDPALPGYRDFFERVRTAGPGRVRCELVVGPPVGVAAAWNALAEKAGGDFLLMANDDQVYVEHAWDVRFDEQAGPLLAEHPDEVLCLYFDGGQYADGACDFPILSRRWYDTLGYFTPTLFEQWENEQWVFDVARRAGRLFPVEGVFVEHRHYQDYKAPFDETYQRHRLGRRKSLADHALFVRTGVQREADAERLRGMFRARPADARPAAAQPAAAQPAAAPPTRTEETAVTPVPDTSIGIGAYTEQAARRYFSHLIDAWNFAGRYDEGHECARLAVQQGIWTDPMQRPREYIRGLEAKPLHDPADFWFIPYLEENYPKIRAEVEAVLAAAGGPGGGSVYNTDPDDRTLARQGTWDQAFLFRDGDWQEEIRALFPVTAGVVAGIPEATTLNPGVVSFSRVEAGTHLAAHCGASNALLRVHMGIDVPEGLTLRVGEEHTTWREGRCLIFDDSYEHEVWHRGDRDRIVLILDVLHPQLNGDLGTRAAPRRLAAEDEVLSFVRERGLEAIESDGEDMVFHPNAATRTAAQRYMRATGATGVRVDAAGVRWDRPSTVGAPVAGR